MESWCSHSPPHYLLPAPLVMIASLHSSKIITRDGGGYHDPEVFVKVGVFDNPVMLVKVEVVDAPEENDDDVSEDGSSLWEVTLEKSEDPKTMPTWYKWAIVLTASCGAMCVTSASSMVSAARHTLPQSDLTCSYL